MTNEEFVELACPHSWFLVADDLHLQAVELRQRFGRGHLTHIDHRSKIKVSWDNANRSTFLLASFALENSIKAFLVYENPGWISNGTLAKNLRSHELTDLAKMSTNIPYKEKGKKTLRAFEEGNESWARYPCALKKEDSAQPLILNEELWDRYEHLMAAYGRRLIHLLSTPWKGPHGFRARYEIKGNYLGASR
ncbi:hypothetical protein [Kushneria indalinina]|uniref:Uncharacterized protein n=1 Tax=Kushneria indalinina DSM 14324 TaxID=1122140 RepID=A0A3D9E069_9GAMM|nr:hypothetical protein [Kushneria indalinina]REC96427.1 hypothetical protein C8D72_1116 [Kushneria indalinina DSM 14324]